MSVNLTQTSGGGAGAPGNAGGTKAENVGNAAGGAANNQDNGSPGGSSAADTWTSGLKDVDNQKYAKDKGWTDLDAAFKSHRELEKQFSSRPAMADAPKSADDYKFNVPTDLPAEASYNAEFAGWFKQTAHKLKVPNELAAGFHDAFVDYAKGAAKAGSEAAAAALEKSVNEATKALEGAWGQQEGPVFKRNVELAMRSMRMLGIDPASVGAVTKDGTVTNAAFVQAMAKVGNGMFAEDTLYGSTDKGVNPFDPKTENLVQQGRMIKENRDQAKLMIEAAGRRKEFPSLFK